MSFYPQQNSQSMGLNPDHCTDRLATNRLSHGTVLIRVANYLINCVASHTIRSPTDALFINSLIKI